MSATPAKNSADKGNKTNYILHLNAWFNKVYEDDRLNPTHISMYLALFQLWNQCRFENPLSIARSEVMKLSKIGSKSTYTKCLKELHLWKFIDYRPSNNPVKGSLVYMYTFGNSTGHTTGASSERVLVPYINSNKPIKHLNNRDNQNKDYDIPL